MATLGDITTKVSRKLLDANQTAVTLPEVVDGINEAIRYWKQKEIFFFNQLSTTLTTTQGDPLLNTAGANILWLDKESGMVIPYQNWNYVLYPMSPDTYDRANNNSPGRPYAYSYRNGGYYLYWIPDQAYTVQISGAKDYADLVNPSDTNDWTQYADMLIVYEALSRLYPNRDDFGKADAYTNGANAEASMLRKRTANMMATGTMRVDLPTYYDNYFMY